MLNPPSSPATGKLVALLYTLLLLFSCGTRQLVDDKEFQKVKTIYHEDGDSTALVIAGEEYAQRNGLKRFFLGDAYRKEWSTPVERPFVNMDTMGGGLTPLKLGGGQTTLSLRCKGADGNEYTLRSVNKYPEPILPEHLHRTLAHGLLRDGMSAAHPYGALVVPPLAEAVDVFHTGYRSAGHL